MALNQDGVVIVGGISYLMPLCAWHNSTARDEKNFEHSKTRMLELSGFMEGQTALTFNMRRKDLDTHRIAIKKGTGWKLVAKSSLDRGTISEVAAGLSVTSQNPFVILSLDHLSGKLMVTDANL